MGQDQTINYIGARGGLYGAALSLGYNSGGLIENWCDCNIQLNADYLFGGKYERYGLFGDIEKAELNDEMEKQWRKSGGTVFSKKTLEQTIAEGELFYKSIYPNR